MRRQELLLWCEACRLAWARHVYLLAPICHSCAAVPIVPNPDNYPWCYEPPASPSPSPAPPPVENNLTLTIDLVDLFLVAPPLPQPLGSLSVIDKGADPTGVLDSTTAFAATVTAARAAGVPVWVPTGNFTVTAHVLLDNVTVLGAGSWYSVVHGAGVGLYGNAPPGGSSNVQVCKERSRRPPAV